MSTAFYQLEDFRCFWKHSLLLWRLLLDAFRGCGQFVRSGAVVWRRQMNNRFVFGVLVLGLGLSVSGGMAFADAAADVAACDMLAASPYDKMRPATVPGVAIADVKADAAIAACKTALTSNPQNLRVMYDLARALNKAEKEPALQFELDLKASASGNPAMIFNLANNYISGIGTAKDEAKGYQMQCDAATKGMEFAMSFCGDNFRFDRIKNDKGEDENKKTGFGWYQKGADAGDGRGIYKLGNAYFYGRSVEADKAKGNALLQKAADLGNAEASNDLGANYLEGEGVPRNVEKAVALYQQAAKLNNITALNNLGSLYLEGKYAPKNPALAKDYYERGIALGAPASMNDFGFELVQGTNYPKDIVRGVALVRQAAKAENAYALYNMGTYNEQGIGMSKDVGEAINYYSKAAEQNHTSAMMRLAVIAEEGLWKEAPRKNKTVALSWYIKAALHGDDEARKKVLALAKAKVPLPEGDTFAAGYYQILADAGQSDAMVELALLLEDGKGVNQDLVQAFEYDRAAANVGNIAAMNNLGMLYENGKGVDKDLALARAWYEKSSTAGNVDASNNLAVLYENGSGVVADINKALSLYEKAAKAGNTTAMANLGGIYENGRGVPKDFGKAVKWYQKGVAAGGGDSMGNLGYLYSVGEGVKKNPAKANALFRQSAVAGNTLGMNNYGYDLAVGDGVKQNVAEGLKWLNKAIEAGGKEAPTSLAEIIEAGKVQTYNAGDVAKYYLLGLQRDDGNAKLALIEKAGKDLRPETIAAIQAQLKSEGKTFQNAAGVFDATVLTVLRAYVE